KRLGLDWHYAHPRQVFDEMRLAMPSIAGITWDRLEAEDAVTYPCEREGDPGDRVVFTQDFPTATGRARLVPADVIPAAERPRGEGTAVEGLRGEGEPWRKGELAFKVRRRAVALAEPSSRRGYPMKVAVIGAGAIGGDVGVKLALAGEDVTFVVRGANLDAIRKNGMKLIMHDGTEHVAAGVKATNDYAEAGPQDLVILAMKAHQVEAVAGD